LGSAVLEFYASQYIFNTTVSIMGVPDRFIEHGSIKEQRQETNLTVNAVCEEIHKLMVLHSYEYGKVALHPKA
jgi:1-deoxy-D-xylulose-5-phosphate synthase